MEEKPCPREQSTHSRTQNETHYIASGTLHIEEHAFFGCAFCKIVLPDSVISVGENAFSDSPNLTEVVLGKGVRSIAETAFSNCPRLTSVRISSDNAAYASEKGVLYDKAKTRLLVLPEGITEITLSDALLEIPPHAFHGYTHATAAILPDSVVTVGENAFYGCTNLTRLTVGEGVRHIGRFAFEACERLADVRFKNPNGWQADGEPLPSDDLANPKKAAALLKEYAWYLWTRGEA